MAFAITIKDPEIKLEEESTRSVQLSVDIPRTSQARAKDIGVTLTIVGKILVNTRDAGTAADSTAKLLEWSKVPGEKKEAFRSVVVESKAAGITTRKYEFPNMYILDYKEEFSSTDGTGEYTLLLRQVRRDVKEVKISGGFQ